MSDKCESITDLPKCSQQCILSNTACTKQQCDHWIPFKSESNCDLVSIFINGPMSLRQIGERIGISYVRVKQIEDIAIKKIKENSIDNPLETI